MTDAVQVQLIIGIPILITAIVTGIVSLHTAFKTTRIETATNGTLHAMQKRDDVQAEEMKGLRKQIEMLLEDKRTNAEIAKTLAVDAKALKPPVTGHADIIDANTKAVIENTEATDINSDIRAGVQPKKWG